jgi:hypothetical protein
MPESTKQPWSPTNKLEMPAETALWKAQWSDQREHWYWWNTQTHQTVWSQPHEQPAGREANNAEQIATLEAAVATLLAKVSKNPAVPINALVLSESEKEAESPGMGMGPTWHAGFSAAVDELKRHATDIIHSDMEKIKEGTAQANLVAAPTLAPLSPAGATTPLSTAGVPTLAAASPVNSTMDAAADTAAAAVATLHAVTTPAQMPSIEDPAVPLPINSPGRCACPDSWISLPSDKCQAPARGTKRGICAQVQLFTAYTVAAKLDWAKQCETSWLCPTSPASPVSVVPAAAVEPAPEVGVQPAATESTTVAPVTGVMTAPEQRGAHAVLGYDTTGDGKIDGIDTNQDGSIDTQVIQPGDTPAAGVGQSLPQLPPAASAADAAAVADAAATTGEGTGEKSVLTGAKVTKSPVANTTKVVPSAPAAPTAQAAPKVSAAVTEADLEGAQVALKKELGEAVVANRMAEEEQAEAEVHQQKAKEETAEAVRAKQKALKESVEAEAAKAKAAQMEHVTDSPESDGSDTPESNWADSPEGDGSDTPESDGSDSPDDDGSDTPETNGSDSPDGDGSDAPEMDGT